MRKHLTTLPPSSQNLGSDVNDGYGSDLMGDADDRAHLATLTELERESVLFDRAEARDNELKRRRALRLAKGFAPRATSDDDGDAAAASTAHRADAAKRDRLAALAAARAGRAAADDPSRRRADTGLGDDDDYDAGAGGASDDDDAYARRRGGDADGGAAADDDAADPGDVAQGQLRRAHLERWANEPFLPKYAVGTYVRVAFRGRYVAGVVEDVVSRERGTHRDGAGVALATPYSLPRATGGSLTTDRWLRVARGADVKWVPFTVVSNHTITEGELESLASACRAVGAAAPTRRSARSAARALADAATHTYTEADVAAIVASKRAAAGGGGGGAVAAQRARLAALRDAAAARGDAAAAAEHAAALAAVEARASARSAGGDRTAGLVALNARNAARNVANALAGVDVAGGDGEAGGALDADAAAAAPAARVQDPFRRRETRPRHMWATRRRAPGEEFVSPDKGGARAEDKETQNEDAAATADAGPTFEGRMADLEVDVASLDVGGAPAAPRLDAIARSLLGGWTPAPGAGAGAATKLSLDDYYRRRGEAT